MRIKSGDKARFPNSLLIAIGLLALLLPLTIVVVQQQSTIRSQAAQDFKNGVKNPPFGALGPCTNPVDCPEPTVVKISERPQEAFPATQINQPTKKVPDEPCKNEHAPIDKDTDKDKQPRDNYDNAPDQGNHDDQKYSYNDQKAPKKKTKKKGLVRKGVTNIFNFYGNDKPQEPYNNAPKTSYPDEKQVYKDNNKNPDSDPYKAPEKKPENNGYNTYPETPQQKQPYEQNYDPNGGQTDPYKQNGGQTDPYKQNEPEYTTNNTYNKNTKNSYAVTPTQKTYNEKPLPTVYQQPTAQKKNQYNNNTEPQKETQYPPKDTTYTGPNNNDTTNNTTPDQYTNTTTSVAVAEIDGAEISTFDKPHWQPNGGVTGSTEALVRILIEILNILIKALGGQGNLPSPNFHDPCGPQFNLPDPQPQPLQPQPAPSSGPSKAPSSAPNPSNAQSPSNAPSPSKAQNPSSAPSNAPQPSQTALSPQPSPSNLTCATVDRNKVLKAGTIGPEVKLLKQTIKDKYKDLYNPPEGINEDFTGGRTTEHTTERAIMQVQLEDTNAKGGTYNPHACKKGTTAAIDNCDGIVGKETWDFLCK